MSNIVEKIESSVKDAVGVVKTEAAKAVTAVEPVSAKAEAGIAKAEANAAATLAAPPAAPPAAPAAPAN